jgi:hypothetical protein
MGELGGDGTGYSRVAYESGFYGGVSRGQLAVKAIRQTVRRTPPVSCTKYQPAESRNAAHALPRNPAAIGTRVGLRMVSHVTSTGGIPKIGPIRTTGEDGVARAGTRERSSI